MTTPEPEQLQLFRGEAHQPFLWENGRSAALLLHGFPGTPAEIRPLAETIHRAGWTVQGLLMPGFGSQIPTLPQRRYQEWVEAARNALTILQQQHEPVVLIGYSMGGAVALNVTAVTRPHALVLLAPFWRLGSKRHTITWNLLKPLLRHIRPLRKADFNHPRLRHFLNLLLPDANLDDPLIQQTLRELPMPVRLMDQLRQVGRAALQAAPQAHCPTLVLQGSQDDIVRPATTHRLTLKLPQLQQYVELAAPHQLINPALPSWPLLEKRVMEFLATVGK